MGWGGDGDRWPARGGELLNLFPRVFDKCRGTDDILQRQKGGGTSLLGFFLLFCGMQEFVQGNAEGSSVGIVTDNIKRVPNAQQRVNGHPFKEIYPWEWYVDVCGIPKI
jgi:hypothetical protein